MSELHVVLGAGPVGRAAAEALYARGLRVRILSKTGRMQEPPAGAEVRAVDILDKAGLDAAVKGAAAVYQCAQPPYGRWAEEFPAFQRAVLEAAERAGARLVLAENLYGYGDRDGTPIRDDSPFAATDTKGRTRAAMSEEAFAAHAAGRLPVTSARASDFFGPWAWGQSYLGARSLGPLARGKPASVLGSPDVPHTFTYTRDFGEALAVLGTTGRGDGRAWLVPNDRPLQTQREALSLAAGPSRPSFWAGLPGSGRRAGQPSPWHPFSSRSSGSSFPCSTSSKNPMSWSPTPSGGASGWNRLPLTGPWPRR